MNGPTFPSQSRRKRSIKRADSIQPGRMNLRGSTRSRTKDQAWFALSVVQTTKRMVWIEIPCHLLRKDKILQHQRSKCHMDSILTESHAAASRVSGGIRSALQEQLSMQCMGVISALKCLYWLVKEEVAHHTKFGSLLELAKSIGCPTCLN